MTFYIDTIDKRTKILKNLLNSKNLVSKEFSANNLKVIAENDTIIFSPAKKLTDEIVLALPDKVSVICGNVNDDTKKIFFQKQIVHKNIMQDETFAIKNAKLTAEGILAIMIEKSPKSIYENNVLILGSGRIATSLAVMLGKLGVKFSIVTYDINKLPKFFIYTDSVFYGNDFFDHIDDHDIIVNTIPAQIITDNQVKQIPDNTIFIETASVDCLNKNLADNFEYIPSPGLPQKYSAQSAAALMMDYILGG